MTRDTQRDILQRAQTKTDGVYSFRGVTYRVKNGAVTHFAYDHQILVNGGVFVVPVGTYEYQHTLKTLLKTL